LYRIFGFNTYSQWWCHR